VGFGERLIRVFEAVVADSSAVVGDIAILDSTETQLLAPVSGPDCAQPQTLVDILTAAVDRDRSAVAVRSEGRSITYGELDAESSRLARMLISRGVGPESLVALAFPRSYDMVRAVWAVAKSGAAYVPVDPSYPDARVRHMVTDSEAVLGLTTEAHRDLLPDEVEWIAVGEAFMEDAARRYTDEAVTDSDRVAPLSVLNAAYVIYTSGSTGMPKGVAVTHTGLRAITDEAARRYRLDQGGRFLHICSPSFDPSVLEWMVAFSRGAVSVIVPADVIGGVELHEILRTERVTHAIITPAVLGTVDPTGLDDIEVVSVGGDVTSVDLLGRWQPGHRYFNAYGPTETTIISSYAELRAGEPITIGVPVPGVRAVVLDGRLNPVPVGVSGELYFAGGALARGYHGRHGLTADRFVADPFGQPGSRMYRTGDVVRWSGRSAESSAGELVYVGRSDFQTKIRGFRVELGEVDAALAGHPSVDFAATLVRTLPSGSPVLVSYVCALAGSSIDVRELTEFLGISLPPHMIPSAVIVLESVPLTPVGKLDRDALPEPEFEMREFRSPRTPVEEIVAQVFAEVLGVERVGLDDDFFDLGGNSLIATQVVSRLSSALDARVPVRDLFEHSTVESLAVRAQSREGQGSRQQLTAGDRPDVLPLSLAQQRMWFLNRFDSDSTAYSIPLALRLAGVLDVEALEAAVADVVERHESLRTIYPEGESGPVQIILPSARVAVNLTPVSVDEDDVVNSIVELVSRGFDVTQNVPLRMRLFRTGDDAFVLAAAVHHISADGASTAPFARDVMVAYAARVSGSAPTWSPLEVQYADYALWQRRVLGSETDEGSTATSQIAYWTKALNGLPDELALPTDRRRPAVQSFRGGRVSFALDAALHAALRGLARERNATLFMAAHTAFAILLARLSGTRDIAVGTPIAGRGDRALDDLIGMFVNTLVFRSEIDTSKDFFTLLDQVREVDLQAFAHADVPFERLVEVLNPVRSTARHPLFQVGFSFQNHQQTAVELAGLNVEVLEVDQGIAQFDLQLVLADRYDDDGAPAGIEATFSYATDLFDSATVERFASRFCRLISSLVSDPSAPVGDLSLMEPNELVRVVNEWNDTGAAVGPGATLVDLFDEQVGLDNFAPALYFQGREISYSEFDSRVNRLARWLIEQGVGPESLVALHMSRSFDLVVAMYAVVKAGGAYVPLDPSHPRERIALIVETATPACVLSSAAEVLDLDGVQAVTVDSLDLSGYAETPIRDGDRIGSLSSTNTAYVIFTSGSTGRPKGVAVSHASIVNQLLWKRHYFGLDASDSVLLKTAATFDLSVWEFWSALTSGARLVIAEPDGHRDPDYLVKLLREEKVTTLHIVPSMLSMLVTAAGGGLPSTLRRVLAIGEELPVATAREFLAANSASLFNLYGPTEAAVSATVHHVTDTSVTAVPIGVPEWNTRAYVLDERLRPTPPGVAGELYLAGAQLARGYQGRPDLTSDRFVADPFGLSGTKMYRTGDLARWSESGQLEYLGRVDFQVKIRGFRIELGEIESVLRRHENVAAAVVVNRSDPHVGDSLVAYVSATPGTSVDPDALRSFLSTELPSYMIPTDVAVLENMPLNVNGKIDRKALPEIEVAERTFRAPATPIEQIVAGVFGDLLGVDRVGRDDDFFALGGNSLVATRAAARLGAALDGDVPVRALFEASTVQTLAMRVEELAGTGSRTPLEARPRPNHVPLSLAQQRMWVINRIDPQSGAYNVPIAIRLSGRLDVDALGASVRDVVLRHEILRTVYPDSPEGPAQKVVPISQIDLRLDPVMLDPQQLADSVAAIATEGFDVTDRVPIRTRLFELAPDEHVFVVVVHHISGDAFSTVPLTRDVMTAYSARAAADQPGWSPLAVQYADYTLWQREVLGEENDPASALAGQLDYWTRELAGVPELIELPTDRPRPPRPSMKGATVEFSLGARGARLAQIARENNSTMFMAIHSVLAVLLSRLSGGSDITVGTPVAGRGEQQLDDLVGMFVNTLVLRTDVSPAASFEEMLAQARTKDLAAFGNADVPFERLVEAVGRERSSAYSPLFQVMLTFQNIAVGSLELPGLEVTGLGEDYGQAKFDLQLTAVEEFADSGELDDVALTFTYAEDLFDRGTVELFAARFSKIVDAVVEDPSVVLRSIDIVTDAEREASKPVVVRTIADIPELVDRANATDPAGTALRHEDRVVTYEELAAKFAAVSQAMGAALKPEALVSVALTGLIPGIVPALGAQGYAELLEGVIAAAEEVIAS
ncbi:non-ribosomal peptide synthetase, partial [Rhodococcus qingshengii]